MKIVMVTTNDPAGTAIQFTRALNRFTPHRCRLITTELRYNFYYEKDLHVPWLEDYGELEQVLAEADLFHFHMTADEDLPLGPFRVRDFHRGQPVIHHHHGEPAFRGDPRPFVERERALGRQALVSTPDLLRLHPEARWIPNPVPLDDPDYMPAERPEREEIWVGHSPTRRELKNTEEFRAVMERLAAADRRLRACVIENTPHRECLRIKSQCDLFFDHMQGYFGVSSLEALSLGVPTVAGLDAWNRRCLREFTGSEELPWIVARNADELERVIRRYAGSRELRKEAGKHSRAWMVRCWTPARIASELAGLYEVLADGARGRAPLAAA